MISFKAFVTAIHEAVISASQMLMDKNVELLDKYFVEDPRPDHPATKDVTDPIHTLYPRTVILEYPHLNADGKVENLEVTVPLITLVPISMPQIEKAVITAEFDMEVINGDLQLNFTNRSSSGGIFKKKSETSRGSIKITLTPQETTEGLKILIEGYEAILKKQIS